MICLCISCHKFCVSGIQENSKALEHGEKYLEAANKSGKVHFIQLAYHVIGWLHLQIYLNSDAKQESLLEKVMSFAVH